jgi:hypothetical protein
MIVFPSPASALVRKLKVKGFMVKPVANVAWTCGGSWLERQKSSWDATLTRWIHLMRAWTSFGSATALVVETKMCYNTLHTLSQSFD